LSTLKNFLIIIRIIVAVELRIQNDKYWNLIWIQIYGLMISVLWTY